VDQVVSVFSPSIFHHVQGMDNPRTRLITVFCLLVPDAHMQADAPFHEGANRVPSILEIDLAPCKSCLVHSLATCSYLLALRLRTAGRFVLLQHVRRRAGPDRQIARLLERPAASAAPGSNATVYVSLVELESRARRKSDTTGVWLQAPRMRSTRFVEFPFLSSSWT
jgi:hypothetical protein